MREPLPPRASIPALYGLWHDVSTGMEKADTDETTVIAMRNITWRSKESSLQDWMPALVSLVISRAAGKVMAALCQKQLELRQLWMRHGGPIFTTDGNRRKRKYVGEPPPSVDELREDVERLKELYAKVARGREGDVVTAMAVISGAICSIGCPRKKSIERFHADYDKLKPARPWHLPFPRKVLHLPWGRRLR